MTDFAMTEERLFTERELQQFDGTRGKPAYIAYDGVVYDVTGSSLRSGGLHQDLHYAGTDSPAHCARRPIPTKCSHMLPLSEWGG
jgi:predicted heme/steroid binding protein